MQKISLVILSLVLFLPNLFETRLHTTVQYNGKEKFDSRYSHINSIKKLEAYTDSIAANKKLVTGSYEYVEMLGSVLEKRFYHGFSHFSLAENWLAAVAGILVKEDYACKVQPDEIIQHNNAACSQQALVMMQVLRNKNIPYRSIGFPHHYAMEVQIDNQWYFFDSNMEPDITKEQRNLKNWNHQNDAIKKYYNTSVHECINYQFGINQTAIVGAVNEIPAQRAGFFHLITKIFSKILWLFPLAILLYKRGFSMNAPFLTGSIKKKKPLIALPA